MTPLLMKNRKKNSNRHSDKTQTQSRCNRCTQKLKGTVSPLVNHFLGYLHVFHPMQLTF